MRVSSRKQFWTRSLGLWVGAAVFCSVAAAAGAAPAGSDAPGFTVRMLASAESLAALDSDAADAAAATVDVGATCAAKLPSQEYLTLPIAAPEALTRSLTELGMSAAEAKRALKLLKQKAGLKDLREAQQLLVARKLDPCDPARAQVMSVTLAVEGAADVTLVRSSSGAFEVLAPEDKYVFHLRVAGQAQGDLLRGLTESGLPAAVAEQVLDLFDADAALTPEEQRRARFDVVYQMATSTAGAPLEAVLTAAELSVDGRARRLYHYKRDGAAALFLDAAGSPIGDAPSVAALELPAEPDLRTRQPIPSAAPSVVAAQSLPEVLEMAHPLAEGRYTSGYGWRRHPVLGKRRFHNGVDYAAPRGTPIVAAADGVVLETKRHNTYGKLIQISHGPQVETRYAHLSGFARGVQPGAPVKKGQVIGYVGRTGISTGNHLYFELIVNDRFVNPLRNIAALDRSGVNTVNLHAGANPQRFIAMADALFGDLAANAPALKR